MKKKVVIVLVLLVAVTGSTIYLHRRELSKVLPSSVDLPGTVSDELVLIKDPKTPAEKIVNGAKMEAMRTVTHDGAYYRIGYPGGDVPEDRGACTDVVVRALRNAGYDLQKLIHEDMKRNFGIYQRYGQRQPDHNIDHRRVPNQMTFFRRHGKTLPMGTTGDNLKTWQPGDIIYWKLWDRLDHCGVISNDKTADGVPLVIHNIGESKQADCLTEWRIIGHFRYPR